MDNVLLDFDKLKTISNSIKKMTHSGFQRIELGRIGELITICRTSDKYVEHAFSRIMISLKENHSEVRLGAVLLCDHFFDIFPRFRTLLLDNLNNFLKYTFGEKFNQNLPPPPEVAQSVIKTTIKSLHAWFLKFGKDYPKLATSYNDLRNEKCVDFDTLEIFNRTEREKREKARAETMRINQSLFEKACDEMKEMENDITDTLTTMNTCFDILLDFPNPHESNSSVTNGDLRLHGVLKPSYSVELELDTTQSVEIKMNDENSAIIDNVRETFSLIDKKYLPKVKAWSVLISKVGADEQLSNKVMVLENKLMNAAVKFKKIKFVEEKPIDDDCVSTDSELEEVENEVKVKETKEEELEKDFFKDTVDYENVKPGTSKPKESYSERKKQLLEIAPKLPYSMDLYDWENGAKSTETLLPTATDGHRFWASSSVESIEVPAESANLRVIEFTGKFEPVTRSCRAPLPSGKLCPRLDRVKCPLHGLIVPRDNMGAIVNKDDEEKVTKSKHIETVPDWQDPKLLAELKASTGVDLKVGKKRRRRNPGLTDIKKKETSFDKISKKIFKKSTLKKVNKTLDRLDYKRHRDKFGDQFNYVHSN